MSTNTNAMQPTAPQTMQAAVLTTYGTDFPKTCSYVPNYSPVPTISNATDVLVHIEASGFNSGDAMFAVGDLRHLLGMFVSLPKILGVEFAGTVAAIGTQVSRFKIGDRVMGVKKIGTHCEYVVATESEVGHIPAALSMEEAASMPVGIITAFQALQRVVHCSDVKPQQESVLVIGASGGMGSFVTLLAKHYFKFKQVYAVCSGKNAAYCKSLGADTIIDYTMQQFEQVIPANSVVGVVNTIMSDANIVNTCAQVLKPSSAHGIYVTVTAPTYFVDQGLFGVARFAASMLWYRTWSIFGYPYFSFLSSDGSGQQMQDISQWMVDNKMLGKIQVKVLPLKDLHVAMQESASKRTVGKIVLQIANTTN